MSSISVTKLYEQLSAIIGKEPAENLTNFIVEKTRTEVVNISQLLATKEDLRLTREGLQKEILTTREELASLKGEIKAEMAANKTEMIKWMFLFWIGQMATTFGFIMLFLKK